MPRCGCAQDQCDCNFIAGDNITITGTGSRSNPYTVTADIPPSEGGGEGSVERLTGEIMAYGGTSAPAGWLICNGTTVSRATYAALFAIIGTAYGAGDGVTTFTLPNLSGKFPRGASAASPRGSSGGTDSQTLTTANMPLHTHPMPHTHTINHNHASATTSENGFHDHEIWYAPGPGGSDQSVSSGLVEGQALDRNSIGADGAHTHSVDLPNFTGTSGASSTANTSSAGSAVPTALDNKPAFAAVTYLIKS